MSVEQFNQSPDRREAIHWDDVMAFGLGVLRLSSREFWAMTPVELAAAIRGASGDFARVSAPDVSQLSALMRAFPDRNPNTEGAPEDGKSS